VRPVDKGAKTMSEYAGTGARDAYETYIEMEARQAAGTDKTLAFHQGKATTLKTPKARQKHQDIVDEIIRQGPLQKLAKPFEGWMKATNARQDDYRDAKEKLVAIIGEYCSFCERRIVSKLDVEHKAPKDVYTGERLEWRNFLLACGNCNSVKLTKHKVLLLQGGVLWQETTPVTYCFWPDQLTPERAGNYKQDSYNVLQYQELGVVTPHPSIPDGPTRDRVLATMAMVGLDRTLDDTPIAIPRLGFRTDASNATSEAQTGAEYELSNQAPSTGLMSNVGVKVTPTLRLPASRDLTAFRFRYGIARFTGLVETKDYRALHRHEAWDKAEHYRERFDLLLVKNPKNFNDQGAQQCSYEEFEQALRSLTKDVVNLAVAGGLWSVWVTVFQARGGDNRFNRRPAIVPVLRRLIHKFPGTRPNTDHAPRIYTQQDETHWAKELLAKQQQQQTREEEQFENQLRQQRDIVELEDEIDELKDDKRYLKRENDRLRRERNDAEDDARRYRSERNRAEAIADQYREDLDDADREIRRLRYDLEQARRERDQLGYERNHLGQQRDQARWERDQLGQQRNQANQQRDQAIQQRDQAIQQRDNAQNEAFKLRQRFNYWGPA
jgi:hypothetical protein